MTEDEQRKLRYLDTIRELESEVEQLRHFEGALRRLSHHLCIAARGQSASLDRVLDEMDAVLGNAADVHGLESCMARLQAAVRAVEPAVPVARSGTPAAAGPGPAVVVRALLDRMPPVPGLRQALEEVLAQLKEASAPPDWDVLLSGMAGVLKEQCLKAQQERRELESFLKEITDRLGEFDAFLVGQEGILDTARQNGVVLETRIQGEVKVLHDGMASAASLDELRALLSERLDAISEHVRGFREAEERRCQDHKVRAERMHQRIVQLEHEAQSLQRAMENERRTAMVDQLTGIPNRQAFEERMQQEYGRWKRFATPLTLLVWDVDNFKHINDTYGHQAGDRVIRAIAQALHRRVRETDFAARYGGEEFVMLLAGATGQEALSVAEEIRGEVQSLGFHFRGERVPITISAGIATFAEGDTPETAFDNADRALYEAKNTGRNRCVLH